MPATSTLNYPDASAIANTAVVQAAQVGGHVRIGIYNGSSTGVHVIADLAGVYFNDGTPALRYSPLTPQCILDSRTPKNGSRMSADRPRT